MEFTVTQANLKDALTSIAGCIDRKATIPVLQNILIVKTGEHELRLTATDLDVTIEKTVEATIAKGFEYCCVSGSKLFDIVKSLPKGDVRVVKQENDWITLSCARSNFKLAGVPFDKYPERNKPVSMPFSVTGDVFKQMVERTTFAITNEQSRFTLNGAKCEIEEGWLRMVSTDGHRLSFNQVPFANAKDKTLDVMIPRKAMSEIAKMADHAAEGAGGIQFGADHNHISCNSGGQLLLGRKLSGQFPNYKIVMPDDNDKKAVVGAEDLKAAIRRVSQMADERSRKIVITLKPGEMTLTAEASETGESQETLPCTYQGDETVLLFQWIYLYEFLNVATRVKPEVRPGDDENAEAIDTQVYLTFKDQNAQAEWGIEGDETWRYIVMPLRG